MSISDITDTIEIELRTTPWTERQFQIFRSVYNILKRYEAEAEEYRVSVKDKQALLAHIQEQHWFPDSHNKAIITAIIQGLRVVGKKETDESYKLTINFPTHGGIFLKIKYERTEERLRCAIYLQDSTQDQIAYLVNFDSHHGATNQTMPLPQLDEFSRFCPTSLKKLTNLEQIQLIATICDFYDQNRKNYPKRLDPSNPPLMQIALNRNTEFNLSRFCAVKAVHKPGHY